MCPIVPMLTCGLLRSNFSLPIAVHSLLHAFSNAGHSNLVDRGGFEPPYVDRRADLQSAAINHSATCPNSLSLQSLERETGIEPATNSLEGCDSTTELLPPAETLVDSG